MLRLSGLLTELHDQKAIDRLFIGNAERTIPARSALHGSLSDAAYPWPGGQPGCSRAVGGGGGEGTGPFGANHADDGRDLRAAEMELDLDLSGIVQSGGDAVEQAVEAELEAGLAAVARPALADEALVERVVSGLQ